MLLFQTVAMVTTEKLFGTKRTDKPFTLKLIFQQISAFLSKKIS